MRRPSFEIFPLVLAFTAALDAPPLAAQADVAPDLTPASSVRGLAAVPPPPWISNPGQAAGDTAVYLGWTPQADETVPMYAWSVDAMTRAAGLVPLRDPRALGGARREVRLWMGFDLSPHWMLRVVDDPAGARGELRFWWTGERGRTARFHGTPRQRAEHDARIRKMSDRMRRDTRRAGCTEHTEGLGHETCRFTFRREPNWGAILAKIDSLDAWTLANPATLTPPLRGGWHGGSVLVVEVRDGDRYRTYAYWCPSRFPYVPEAVRADALAQLAEPMLARWRSIMQARFDEQQRRWYREHLRRERAKL